MEIEHQERKPMTVRWAFVALRLKSTQADTLEEIYEFCRGTDYPDRMNDLALLAQHQNTPVSVLEKIRSDAERMREATADKGVIKAINGIESALRRPYGRPTLRTSQLAMRG